MKYKVLLVAAGLWAASVSVYGQSKLAGKWQTDNVPATLEARKNAAAQKDAAPAEADGRGGRGGGGGGGGQAIMLDLQVDASGKISGTVNEIGNDPILNIETGMITGKTIQWVTQPRGVTWNLEMTDDDTLTLTGRVFAARGGGPPPGGAAPGAPPAGGPPAGGNGAPRGGGGRGAGRGAQPPIVFHRAK
ncbi:MAG TPA: hypothetical protein VGN17_29225 [Bryobacteraceae bacterium]